MSGRPRALSQAFRRSRSECGGMLDSWRGPIIGQYRIMNAGSTHARQRAMGPSWAERPAVLTHTPAKLCDPRHGSTQSAGEGEVMLQGWVIVAIALAYIGLLFLVASYGDRRRITRASSARLLIYPLSLAIYCTSWTFFGSVGLASRSGFDFLTIYIGPMLMFGLGFPLLIRIVRLRSEEHTSELQSQ